MSGEQTDEPLPTADNRRLPWLGPVIYALLTVVAISWSLSGLEVTPERLSRGLGQAGKIMAQMFLEPDWSYTGQVLEGMQQSIQIAALGTAIAAVLAIPFG